MKGMFDQFKGMTTHSTVDIKIKTFFYNILMTYYKKFHLLHMNQSQFFVFLENQSVKFASVGGNFYFSNLEYIL